MLRGESELGESWAKLMSLGLGLLFLGKQDAVEATVEVGLAIKAGSETGKCSRWRQPAS